MVLLWLVVAIVALLLELASVSFILVFVGMAALVAALLAQLGLGLPLQIVVFAAASLLLPVLLRRRVLARISGRGILDRTDALVGTEARVTQALDPVIGTGRVIAAGQDWAARSTVALPVGSRVDIVGSDGIVLLVEPLGPDRDTSL
jgi:membrane protein implicated in regulation of membrane protease activity